MLSCGRMIRLHAHPHSRQQVLLFFLNLLCVSTVELTLTGDEGMHPPLARSQTYDPEKAFPFTNQSIILSNTL
jgi:hypothetical protein